MLPIVHVLNFILQLRLAEQDKEYIPLMAEREEEYHREMTDKMTKFIMEHAARVIQCAWRDVIANRAEKKRVRTLQEIIWSQTTRTWVGFLEAQTKAYCPAVGKLSLWMMIMTIVKWITMMDKKLDVVQKIGSSIWLIEHIFYDFNIPFSSISRIKERVRKGRRNLIYPKIVHFSFSSSVFLLLFLKVSSLLTVASTPPSPILFLSLRPYSLSISWGNYSR